MVGPSPGLICVACLMVTVVLGQTLPHSILLLGKAENPILVMRWSLNATDVTVELIARTRGWIALGRSPDGMMDKSDILFAWIDPSGRTYVQVCTSSQGRLTLSEKLSYRNSSTDEG